MGKGPLSLGTMIPTVEPGRGGHLFLTENKGEVERGHLSLGTMILIVEPDPFAQLQFIFVHIYIYIYIRTDPIILPCSLACAGNIYIKGIFSCNY